MEMEIFANLALSLKYISIKQNSSVNYSVCWPVIGAELDTVFK